MEAQRYLSVAEDNHGALLALLEHRGATLWAPWSPLRPIFEASFFASWILDPDSGRERRLRGLRCEVLDCFQQRAHRAAFKKLPEVRRLIEDAERQQEQGSLAVYRAEAAALAEPFDRVHQEINIVVELPKLSFARAKATSPRSCRALGGCCRALSTARLGHAAGREPGRSNRGPGRHGHVLVDQGRGVRPRRQDYALLVNACRLFKTRHLEPSPR
jgi:hypothetical protein